ncbi:cupredoxin domain-containing protein [Actinomadura rudentiformis]|uniref:EfeO-type cupredoxin-like domain-containing protein n=1 Tax=Actinomadura rudentiformis TaxID=359158 RepID=A0A6H9Z331_9ACTN|nr:hypothetical protein [Actinomadura rudentiformis]KAB2349069.1 hypothetical protein F8566_15190 [Actinomadura rudentiformis]
MAVAIGVAVTLAGCGEPAAPSGGTGGSGGTSGTGTAKSAPATFTGPSRKPDVTVVSATVSRGKVEIAQNGVNAQGRVKVRRGATVRITVTTDEADEFHLHGYDRTLKLSPGRPGTLDVVADKTGVFEAELHHSGARVFELQVS